MMLQQHLLFTVCATECEAAEEQSDDEAHTLQVPERSEGKTKGLYLLFTVLRLCYSMFFCGIVAGVRQHLPFTVLKQIPYCTIDNLVFVATALTVYGIETTQTHCRHLQYYYSCNRTYRLRY